MYTETRLPRSLLKIGNRIPGKVALGQLGVGSAFLHPKDPGGPLRIVTTPVIENGHVYCLNFGEPLGFSVGYDCYDRNTEVILVHAIPNG